MYFIHMFLISARSWIIINFPNVYLANEKKCDMPIKTKIIATFHCGLILRHFLYKQNASLLPTIFGKYA